MKTWGRVFEYIVVASFVIAAGAVILQAADDAEPGSINWGTISLTHCLTVANSEDIPSIWTVKVLYATDNLYSSHVQTDRGEMLPHYHYEEDFGDQGVPTVAQANRYWDWVFGIVQYDPPKTTRISNATNVQNCHAYAFSQKADSDETHTVAYNYKTSYTYTASHHDFVQVTPKTDVEAGDLLFHVNPQGGCEHTSIVDEVETYQENPPKRRPTSVRWKWAYSGVYTYSPTGSHAFDQPLNICLHPKVKFADQTGTWDQDMYLGPDVWEDD